MIKGPPLFTEEQTLAGPTRVGCLHESQETGATVGGALNPIRTFYATLF